VVIGHNNYCNVLLEKDLVFIYLAEYFVVLKCVLLQLSSVVAD